MCEPLSPTMRALIEDARCRPREPDPQFLVRGARVFARIALPAAATIAGAAEARPQQPENT